MNKDDRAIIDANTKSIARLTDLLVSEPAFDPDSMVAYSQDDFGILHRIHSTMNNNAHTLYMLLSEQHAERNKWRLEEIERYEKGLDTSKSRGWALLTYAMTRVTLDVIIILCILWIIFGLNI
jgi:hypothetical protein